MGGAFPPAPFSSADLASPSVERSENRPWPAQWKTKLFSPQRGACLFLVPLWLLCLLQALVSFSHRNHVPVRDFAVYVLNGLGKPVTVKFGNTAFTVKNELGLLNVPLESAISQHLMCNCEGKFLEQVETKVEHNKLYFYNPKGRANFALVDYGGLYKNRYDVFTSASFKVSLDLRRRTWAESPVHRFEILEPGGMLPKETTVVSNVLGLEPVPAVGDPDAVLIQRLKKEFKK